MTVSLVTVVFGVIPVLVFVALAARSALAGRRREQRDEFSGADPGTGLYTGPQHTDRTRGDG